MAHIVTNPLYKKYPFSRFVVVHAAGEQPDCAVPQQDGGGVSRYRRGLARGESQGCACSGYMLKYEYLFLLSDFGAFLLSKRVHNTVFFFRCS